MAVYATTQSATDRRTLKNMFLLINVEQFEFLVGFPYS